METLALSSIAAVALVSLVAGGRLLRLARRTRGLPESVLGLSLAGITGIGFPILLLTEARATIGPHLTLAADLVGSYVISLGFIGFFVFTWRVFRPDARWAAALTLLGGAVILVATGGTVWRAFGIESSAEKFQAVRDWEILLFTSAALGFGWSAVEALAYWARLRRRAALGLAETAVVNRVLLWGLTGPSAASALLGITALRLLDINYMSAPGALLLIASCGFLASAFLTLAFLPPAAYLRWLEGRARAPHDG